MTPIRTNKPLFFNKEGEPLNGTIYIGQPFKDPRTNPKTVTFRDAGGVEFTADQSKGLTTINGRIVYNGKPIVALVESNFSMLVFDSSGAQVDYSRDIDPDGAEAEADGFAQLTRVGLTLSEIKAFDVAVGESVRNVGKVLATDDLGADWLAVSATGNPADDIDLIDFANGLQGRRIKSVTYDFRSRQAGTFILDDPVKVVEEGLAGIGPYLETFTTIDLSSVVPDEASSAIVSVYLYANYSTATVAERIAVAANARKTGATFDLKKVGFAHDSAAANAELEAGFGSEFSIPVTPNAASDFDLFVRIQDPLIGSGLADFVDLEVTVVGYTVNYDDIR